MMNKRRDEWMDRMSAYLDGEMDLTVRAEMEEHLSGCVACSEALRGLEEVRRQAAALGPLAPPRDLWPAIAEVISSEGEARGARILRLPVAEGPPERAGRRVSASLPQLAAAAVVLVLASAATTWWVGPGLAVRGSRTPPSGVAFTSVGMPGPPGEVADELQDLEREFADVSQRLDAGTLRVIRKNLAVIERAIDDSRRALATDPGNPYLEQHLDGAYERKLTVLREARQIVDWSS